MTRRTALQSVLSPLLLSAATREAVTVPEGLWPVMLTPFHEDKSIDWNALDALTDWYLENGADGLFACCQSSEVWELTEQERLSVTARVIKRAGKIPVVAGGLPGFAPAAVAPFTEKLFDLGIRGAVLTTCQVAEKADPDAVWRERVDAILQATGSHPFGLYEAPRPYKRLLSPETMQWAARTNRFVFHKDTACEINAVAAKVQAVRGTPLRIFNAHVPILIDCIRKGGHGFSGIAANAYPNLISYAVHRQADKPEQAGKVQAFLTAKEKFLNLRYPLSVKVMAGLAGVPIKPVTRRKIAAIEPEQMADLRALRQAADSLLAQLPNA
jgi:4-hydroxy-tetrahydrodipicolinate synthase